jgi:UDP-GlcNAc:undecaprenyl-phosphate GlcNAc-1-phosphate transferase
VPLLDFGLAVLRRVSAGKSPFTADRKHLHHRLLDMGHSHFQAVLIFYAWTVVVAVGCLMFLFVKPTYFVVIFLGVGLVSCTAVTLAPLSRRKRVEMAVQTTSSDELQVTESDRFDPLDEAASVLDPADTDTAAQAAVPELSPPKEHP